MVVVMREPCADYLINDVSIILQGIRRTLKASLSGKDIVTLKCFQMAAVVMSIGRNTGDSVSHGCQR